MLQALPDYVAHLHRYGDGDALKRAAMQEVLDSLRQAGLSQRGFLREAERKGIRSPSPASLSNWLACTHTPKAANLEHLLEALHSVLADRGLFIPTIVQEALRDAALVHDDRLRHFAHSVQDLDAAEADLHATIAWLDLAEFPPSAGPGSAGMAAAMRVQGIRQLEIIRDIHSHAAESARSPQKERHELLAAKAGIVAAHFLRTAGHYAQAFDAADDSSFILAELLANDPTLAEQLTVPKHVHSIYNHMSLAAFVLMGHLRRGNIMADQARLSPDPRQAATLVRHAGEAYRRALEQVDGAPKGYALKPGIWRELAGLALHPAVASPNLEEAETLARRAVHAYANMEQSDYALLYYVSLVTLAKVLTRAGRHVQAQQALDEAQAAASFAREQGWVQPGPLHRALYLLAQARLHLACAQSAGRNSAARQEHTRGWQATMQEGLTLVELGGLDVVAVEFRELLRSAGQEFRRLLPRRAL